MNPFKIEKVRAHLASEKQFTKLHKTYGKNFPEITNNNTPKLWDSLNLDDDVLSIQRNPMKEDRLRTVADWITGDNISVFNAGFGPANLEKVFFMKRNQEHVTWAGNDISSASVHYAKRQFPKGKFYVGTIQKIKEKDASYDFATALEVLEHISPSSTFTALGELHRIVKKGGCVIISVPLNEGLEELVKKGKNLNAHVRVYTPDLIKAELELAGFTVIKAKQLYAFHTMYRLKSLIARFILTRKHPNNFIVMAQKR